MSCAIKIDEDLPADLAELLTRAGHDATTVFRQGMTGSSDEVVWNVVQREGRCLFTADKGFSARAVTSPSHCGLVLFRLPHESRKGYIGLLEKLLQTNSLDALEAATVVVSPEAVRVYRRSAD